MHVRMHRSLAAIVLVAIGTAHADTTAQNLDKYGPRFRRSSG
jgi:hypothetical protein